jgi:hypothetical protein
MVVHATHLQPVVSHAIKTPLRSAAQHKLHAPLFWALRRKQVHICTKHASHHPMSPIGALGHIVCAHAYRLFLLGMGVSYCELLMSRFHGPPIKAYRVLSAPQPPQSVSGTCSQIHDTPLVLRGTGEQCGQLHNGITSLASEAGHGRRQLTRGPERASRETGQ